MSEDKGITKTEDERRLAYMLKYLYSYFNYLKIKDIFLVNGGVDAMKSDGYKNKFLDIPALIFAFLSFFIYLMF